VIVEVPVLIYLKNNQPEVIAGNYTVYTPEEG
jgi:hypothetical protein